MKIFWSQPKSTEMHYCDEVTSVTEQTKAVLNQLRSTLRNNIPQTRQPVSLLIFVLHDWLAHLTQSDSILIEYSTSLGQEIDSAANREHDIATRWLKHIRLQPPSLNVLMYRHSLIAHLLEEEVFTQGQSPLIYQLIGSLYYENPRFYTLEKETTWDRIQEADPKINTIRSQRVKLKKIHLSLANRIDISHCQLDVDHAMLSSFTTLYSLHIVEALLDYELSVRPNTQVQTIRSAISHTLNQLRGVFFHVKN